MSIISGLSSNEVYCLAQKKLSPGNLVIGNSVHSLGVLGSVQSGFKTMLGGEIEPITTLIKEGREMAYQRMKEEAVAFKATGITGVTSQLISHNSHIEFLSIGSVVHQEAPELPFFSTSSTGQALYLQLEAAYEPVEFVFGNVAYSIGLGRGLLGSAKMFRQGEIKEFSDVMNQTRHLALQRIIEHAKTTQANAVINIKTTILPLGGVSEMLMIGTASRFDHTNALFADIPVITTDFTSLELWNMAHMGYTPMKLVLGTSVFSLGITKGVSSFLKSFVRGEINELTSLIYQARESALNLIREEAQTLGADDVIGVKTYVYQLGGGLIEFLAIGTAIKKTPKLAPPTTNLPLQAIATNEETFYRTVKQTATDINMNQGQKGLNQAIATLFTVLFILAIVVINLWLAPHPGR